MSTAIVVAILFRDMDTYPEFPIGTFRDVDTPCPPRCLPKRNGYLFRFSIDAMVVDIVPCIPVFLDIVIQFLPGPISFIRRFIDRRRPPLPASARGFDVSGAFVGLNHLEDRLSVPKEILVHRLLVAL